MSESPFLHRPRSSKPVPRERPPRSIDWFSQLTILNGGLYTQMGWIFLGMGLLFCIIFGMQSEAKYLLAFDGEWLKTEGTVQDIYRTSAEVNDRPVMGYVFSYYAEGKAREAESYQNYTEGGIQVGSTVAVEYKSKNPDRAKIEGMRNEIFSSWVIIVVIFPLVGILMFWLGMREGRKMVNLLKNGQFTRGKLLNKTATGSRVNERTVYAYEFTFEAERRQHIATCKTHQTHLVEDDEQEIILYLPDDPSVSTVFDGIPGVPGINRQGKLTSVPFSNIKYLVGPTLAIGINLIIIIFMFG